VSEFEMPWAIYAPNAGAYSWRYATEKDAIQAAEKLVREYNVRTYVMRITAVLSPQIKVEKCVDTGGEERGT
jgi:hypothetical protein